MRIGMWFLRGDRLVSALQHSKLQEDLECDSKKLTMTRKLSVGKRPISSSNNSGVVGQSFITQEPTTTTTTTTTTTASSSVSRSINVGGDANECHFGNMLVISSYCCVVLVIFALLFILIGSILTYAATQYSDAEVVQFLNKNEYLRVASPLMICLGLFMLIPGIIFWIAKRWCRRPRSNDFVNSSYTNSFFPPEVGPSSHSSQVSPLLQPLSGDGSETKSEWKWPSNQTQLMPPAASFPSSPKLNVTSPLSPDAPSVDLVSESNVDEVLKVISVPKDND